MGLKTFIEVSFQREGIHCYPAAKTDPRLADVSFLGDLHRHIFHFYVKLEVFHDDREVEFILFKRWLEQSIVQSADYQSCEMMADSLIDTIVLNYPGRDVTIRVYEDDENGAIVEWTR